VSANVDDFKAKSIEQQANLGGQSGRVQGAGEDTNEFETKLH
jgi:hypothetical protein